MTLVAGMVAGLLAGRFVWMTLHHAFARRGLPQGELPGQAVAHCRRVGASTGIAAGGSGQGRRRSGGDRRRQDPQCGARALTLLAALGFGLLGAIDDLAGDTSARGFRGHLRALLRGQLTTGGLKLVAGGALALVVCSPASDGTLRSLARDAALVALAANLGNLFDRAPGRVAKVHIAVFVVLAVLVGGDALVPAAVVTGAVFALAGEDLRERLMLGDAGANVLGAVLGLAVVLSCAPATRTTCLLVVLGLNLAAEVISFSRIIDAFPPFAVSTAGAATRNDFLLVTKTHLGGGYS